MEQGDQDFIATLLHIELEAIPGSWRPLATTETGSGCDWDARPSGWPCVASEPGCRAEAVGDTLFTFPSLVGSTPRCGLACGRQEAKVSAGLGGGCLPSHGDTHPPGQRSLKEYSFGLPETDSETLRSDHTGETEARNSQ